MEETPGWGTHFGVRSMRSRRGPHPALAELPQVAFWASRHTFTALYFNVQFPIMPVWGWLLTSIAVTTVINIVGIVVADRVNKALLALTTVALVGLVVMCVVKISGSSAVSTNAAGSLWSPATSIGAVTAAAAIAAYSFLGFDAISTLSEECRDPRRTVPRGILLTVLIGGAIFFVIALLMQMVHPGASFQDESTAGFEVAVAAGGQRFANAFNVMTLIGGFASCIAIQASTSRLMYVMGRDNVLPRRFFGYLHPKFRTPVWNLLLIGAAGTFATQLSLDTATSFINFGAFLAFTVANICVIAAWVRFRKEGERMSVLGYVLMPALGALVDVYLMTKLSNNAILLGVGWLALGIIYLAFVTRGFRRPPPEFDPEAVKERQIPVVG